MEDILSLMGAKDTRDRIDRYTRRLEELEGRAAAIALLVQTRVSAQQSPGSQQYHKQ